MVPLAQPAGVAIAVIVGCALLASVGGRSGLTAPGGTGSAGEPANAGSISVRITPPAYTARPIETLTDPVQVTTIAGSRVRIESQSRVLREWVAVESAGLELRAREDLPARFLSVMVVPDTPPAVRINEPGRDTALATGTGTLTIGLDGRDDLGLASLALQFTKVSGGGENVTFTEGAIPIAIERVSAREWRGRAQWPLDGLGLAEGDVLVYRAVARDANPAGAPVQSDAFLVEIGRSSEIVERRIRAAHRGAQVRHQPADGDLQDGAVARLGREEPAWPKPWRRLVRAVTHDRHGTADGPRRGGVLERR